MWYADIGKTTLLETGLEYNTGVLFSDASYYVVCAIEDCESETQELPVTILESGRVVIDTTICSGESIVVGDSTLTSSGNYIIHESNGDCTVSYVVNLEVTGPLSVSVEDVEICAFSDAELIAEGCEEGVVRWYTLPDTDPIAQGDSYTLSMVESSTTLYTRCITEICESPYISVSIDVLGSEVTMIDTTLCYGDTLLFRDSLLMSAGMYVFSDNSNECTEISVLNLSINDDNVTYIEEYLCSGDTLLINGDIITEPGVYNYAMDTTAGCDSVDAYIVLEIENTLEIYGGTEICFGESLVLSTDFYESYLWSTGDTTRTIEVDFTGFVELTVVDSDGCTFSRSLKLSTISLPQIDVSVVKTLSDCESTDGVIEVVSDVEIESVWYSIDNGSTWQREPIFENLSNQVYEVLIASNSRSCISEKAIRFQFDILGSPFLSDLVVGEDGACDGASGSIDITVEGDPQDYMYSIDGGNTWSENDSYTDLPNGIYTIKIIDIESGCILTYAADINILNIDPSNFDYNIIGYDKCAEEGNASVEITGDDLDMIDFVVWSDGQMGTSIDGLSPGDYTARITSVTGCSFDVSLNIPVADVFVIDQNWPADTVVCNDVMVELNSIYTSFTNNWYLNGSYLGSDISIIADEAGVYTLEVINDLGCRDEEVIEVRFDEADFSGVRFLLSKEGLIDLPIKMVEASNPRVDSFFWEYDRELIEYVSSDLNHEVVIFTEPGEYEISLIAYIGPCAIKQTKTIVIYSDPSELENPENHFTDPGFISNFQITPQLNDGRFTANVELTSNQDVSLILINDQGAIIEVRELTDQNNYSEDFDISNLPSGVYALVLQTFNDWRFVTFSKI